MDSTLGPVLRMGQGSWGVVLKVGDLPREEPAEEEPQGWPGLPGCRVLTVVTVLIFSSVQSLSRVRLFATL